MIGFLFLEGINMKKKLVHGVGVNDANYTVHRIINGKQVQCKFYQTWADMLKRCYSSKYQARYPTYVGCAVAPEWLTFSNFKSWMEQQDWQGKQLDKDLLFKGNKVYSPNACIFVDKRTNLFVIDSGAARGEWPIGVYLRKCGKFRVQVNNPFTNKREHLGYFTCPNEAHESWKKRKHELALELADLQVDARIGTALRNKYSPTENLNNN